MLKIENIEVCYGFIKAIKGVSFEVEKGEIIALIGSNGAGKTTILHTITGLISPKSGKITFEGKDLTKTPAHKILGMGMAHVPEGRRIFQELTVFENLKLGAYIRAFSAFEREKKSACRHAFGRRTADACNGQSAYVQPENYPYGRAVNGTFADFGIGDFPDY